MPFTDEEITREVVFTDYNLCEDDRHTVCLSRRRCDGKLVAIVNCQWTANETDDHEMLRSLAACLNLAADEMAKG